MFHKEYISPGGNRSSQDMARLLQEPTEGRYRRWYWQRHQGAFLESLVNSQKDEAVGRLSTQMHIIYERILHEHPKSGRAWAMSTNIEYTRLLPHQESGSSGNINTIHGNDWKYADIVHEVPIELIDTTDREAEIRGSIGLIPLTDYETTRPFVLICLGTTEDDLPEEALLLDGSGQNPDDTYYVRSGDNSKMKVATKHDVRPFNHDEVTQILADYGIAIQTSVYDWIAAQLAAQSQVESGK